MGFYEMTAGRLLNGRKKNRHAILKKFGRVLHGDFFYDHFNAIKMSSRRDPFDCKGHFDY